jgi:6-pyruvoyltetrahydropterin/6-carboxytetrahydropterin synthase
MFHLAKCAVNHINGKCSYANDRCPDCGRLRYDLFWNAVDMELDLHENILEAKRMRVTVGTEFELSCAHKLNLNYDSPCNKLHGHNYKVFVEITGFPNNNGMIVDFSEIKKAMKKFDHVNLNDLVSQPSVENLSVIIAGEIRGLSQNIESVKVRVFETERNWCEVIL